MECPRPRASALCRAAVVAALLGAAAPGLGATGAGAAEAGQARLTQDGWWNRLQGSQDGEPEGNPARTVIPPIPMPPTVSADAIATSLTRGEADKLAAVGLEVRVPSETVVESLVLRLTEAGRTGGGGGEKIVACPAIGPWGGGKNANWRDRPEYDCTFGRTEGVRAGDGTWTFDLTTLGKKWTAATAPLEQLGVVFAIEAGPATGTPGTSAHTEVSWFSLDTGKMAAELVTRPVPRTATAPGSSQAGASPVVPSEVPPGSPFGGDHAVVAPARTKPRSPGRPTSTSTRPTTASSPGPSESASPVPPTLDTGPGTGAGADDTDDLPTAVLPSARPAVSPGRVEPGNVSFWDHLPGGTPFLALAGLGLAALVGVALGPAGRPGVTAARTGGLSRALSRRADATGSPADDHTAQADASQV